MLFSDLIFEAIVVDVDYERGVCAISPITANSTFTIDEILIPYQAGNGNAGIFCPISVGTRVVAGHTDSRGRESTVIMHVLPKTELQERNFDNGLPSLTPTGTYSYPRMVDGRIVIRGDSGGEILMSERGHVEATTAGGGGVYIKRNKTIASTSVISEDMVTYTNAGKIIAGPVRRMTSAQRSRFPPPAPGEIPLYADPNYANISKPLGFFTGGVCLKRTFGKTRRNPEISEYRMVINEFATDSMFTGFDDEVDRVKNSKELFENSDTYGRNREQGNTLHLAEHELIEIIGGNVVDISGKVLDLNYRPLAYGGPQNTVPKNSLENSYDAARRISRRGIGYHFQLTTNTTANQPSTTLTNFVFDVDKEGVIKVNVPASSKTGNIPFASNANFVGQSDGVEVSYSLATEQESIPVTLRDENGVIIFPDKFPGTHRGTGIRFSNSDENPYFPSPGGADVSEVRVNTTKYHNMYATAEMLIANLISKVNIPKTWGDPDGKAEGISHFKPFEIKRPEILDKEENQEDPSTTTDKFKEEQRKALPTYMSVVQVEPEAPAIDPGGDVVVAGTFYGEDEDPLGNSFESIGDGDEIDANIVNKAGKSLKHIAGLSAHLNFEGAIVSSIGKDVVDGKSIMLDTDGSVVSWFGKDENQRSLIMQTDGDALVNIGDPLRTGITGRFELRVNVSDKGGIDTVYNKDEEGNFIKEEGGTPGADSDIMISLSENGIIIAGIKAEMPMIIRNSGQILIESTNGDLTLKGTNVKIAGPKGSKILKPPSAESGSPLI